MLKYLTNAHNNLEMFDKGEGIYGFFGARAPLKELLGFEKPSTEFILDQHFNPSSKYWHDYVAPLTSKGGWQALRFCIGCPAIAYGYTYDN
jgi:hypothetical protein